MNLNKLKQEYDTLIQNKVNSYISTIDHFMIQDYKIIEENRRIKNNYILL